MNDLTSAQRHWYLVQSKPNQEELAQENLDRQGYHTYLPRTPVRRKKGGRVTRVIAPMFPRYLFIALNQTDDNWAPIRSTIGVSTLVRFGMLPARVPTQLVDNLKKKENSEGYHPTQKKEFDEGEVVRIAEGPFEGYEAIFSAKQAEDRVLVLLKVAEQYAKLTLEPAALEKI